jgi:hypothetical protein
MTGLIERSMGSGVSGAALAGRELAAVVRPRGEVGEGFRIREATEADLPWIDAMQKTHGRELGFLPTMALRGKVAKKEVLVAEAWGRDEEIERRKDEAV